MDSALVGDGPRVWFWRDFWSKKWKAFGCYC